MTSAGASDSVVERSSSPPGRESRQDWKGMDKDEADHARSRSRSPHGNGKAKQFVYDREGSNTTRDEPHFQRARLFVGNIDHKRIRKTDIVKRFAQYGEVLGASIHKGYAFVQMDREKNANKAINYEHNQLFNGTRISKYRLSLCASVLLQTLYYGITLLGCIICTCTASIVLFSSDVEFSQAALKAGAKCKYFLYFLSFIFW